MLEPSSLIFTPISGAAFRIKYLAVIELLGLNDGKVLVYLDLPLAEDVGLGKVLNQVINAVVPVVGLSNHVRSQVPHSLRVSCEVSRKSRLVATRWD